MQPMTLTKAAQQAIDAMGEYLYAEDDNRNTDTIYQKIKAARENLALAAVAATKPARILSQS